MLNKKIMILAILLVSLFAVSAVSAADNVTDDILSLGDENELMDSSEEYNANMYIETATFNTTFMEFHLKVADNYDEKINDAKVILDNISEANFIDADSVYHFNIYTNGKHTFTLDDGFYKAPSKYFTINGLNTNNILNPSSKTTKNTIKLVSKNITMYYDDTTAEIIVKALDNEGKHIRGLNILMNDKITPDYNEKNGYEFLIDYLPVGTHKMKISLDDEKYMADPIYVYVKILKSTPTLTAKKWYSTPKKYVTLRVEVEDKDQAGWIDEGTVTFKINGKSYTVKVHGGDAIKKIKINKAGTYTYTATFKNSNHYTKTVKQKVYVFSTSKKSRTFKIGKYKTVLSKNRYIKLVNAKNNGKGVFFELNTNKFIKQRYRDYYGNSGKYVYKNVNARIIFYIAYGGKQGLQGAMPNKYSMYFTTHYQGPDMFCTPAVIGNKQSSLINKLNSAKVRNYRI